MKHILCYGDSNTWGWTPGTGERFSIDERWPGVLAKELGAGYRIIEEGMNGRTTVFDDPLEGYRNGKQYLYPCLESQRPLDLVILMLGTNDLKKRFSVSIYEVARGIDTLVEIIQESGAGPEGQAPPILLMAPPPLGKMSDWAEAYQGTYADSFKFGEYYRAVAEQRGCHFLDTGAHIRSSDVDGLHWDLDQHLKLGKVVADCVREILK